MNRDERIDLARWLWDVSLSGKCTLQGAYDAMWLGESVMKKLSEDLDKKRREMELGEVDSIT